MRPLILNTVPFRSKREGNQIRLSDKLLKCKSDKVHEIVEQANVSQKGIFQKKKTVEINYFLACVQDF